MWTIKLIFKQTPILLLRLLRKKAKAFIFVVAVFLVYFLLFANRRKQISYERCKPDCNSTKNVFPRLKIDSKNEEELKKRNFCPAIPEALGRS